MPRPCFITIGRGCVLLLTTQREASCILRTQRTIEEVQKHSKVQKLFLHLRLLTMLLEDRQMLVPTNLSILCLLNAPQQAEMTFLYPVYDSSPKKSDQGQIRGELPDGPELIHSMRTRSFSFSSIMTMSYIAPEPRDGESSSFRKEEPEEIVDEPEVVVTSSIRSKPIRGPWDGLVSIFHSQKRDEYKKQYSPRKEEALAVDEQKKEDYKKEQRKEAQKNRPVDSFLP